MQARPPPRWTPQLVAAAQLRGGPEASQRACGRAAPHPAAAAQPWAVAQLGASCIRDCCDAAWGHAPRAP